MSVQLRGFVSRDPRGFEPRRKESGNIAVSSRNRGNMVDLTDQSSHWEEDEALPTLIGTTLCIYQALVYLMVEWK